MDLKQKRMDELIHQIRECRKCTLWKNAKNPVPGEGDLNASLMMIGEAPGYYEDIKGQPFVGSAGRVLDELLLSIGIKRNEIFIGNIIKHRPDENRDPSEAEIKACGSYLERQIQIIGPRLIVTLGRHSTKYVMSKLGLESRGISEIRGKIFEKDLFGMRLKIMPTFHPAASLYNPTYRNFLEIDFQMIKKLLEEFSKII
ncbi:MAG: type-4 uracil-DNA glycosylase [Candidatus Bathyarchaeota archaeon]|nr:type-4 uracil-DNA glycosylase [Candidatus Bathyarchaeota archaeon]